MTETQAAILPKVFISYSWSSPEHQQTIVNLATRLRSDGVDVVLDVWDLKEGQDKYRFMESLVLDKDISRVLMIIDRQYADKADNRTGGVGTETQIISSELYSKVEQTKFIPIVLEYDESEPILPTFVKTLKYIDLSGRDGVDNYEYLVRLLHNKPQFEKPPLGVPPKFLTALSTKTSFTSAAFQLEKSIMTGSVGNIQASAKKLFKEIASEIDAASISSFQTDIHDEEIYQNIMSLKSLRDTYSGAISNLIDYDPTLTLSLPRELFEPLLKSCHHYPESSRKYQNDNIKFLAQELLIITAAHLVKSDSFDVFYKLCSEAIVDRKYYNLEVGTVLALHNPLQSIDEIRKKRLGLNRIYLSADIIKERTTQGSLLSFEDIITGDFFLFLQSLFKDSFWWPRTFVYLNRHDIPEVFVRARSKQYLEKLIAAFGFTSTADFKSKLTDLDNDLNRLSNFKITTDSWPMSVYDHMDFNELGNYN